MTIVYSVGRMEGFQVYVSSQMPSAGVLPNMVPGSVLCYTHNDDITVGGQMYDVSCGKIGSVVSVMIP